MTTQTTKRPDDIPQDVWDAAGIALMHANQKGRMLAEPTDPLECISRAILADRKSNAEPVIWQARHPILNNGRWIEASEDTPEIRSTYAEAGWEYRPLYVATDSISKSTFDILEGFANENPVMRAGFSRLTGNVHVDTVVAVLANEIRRLKGLTPELPPYPPEGYDLPRYGLRWNGTDQPLSVPMDDGYWTPYHLSERLQAALDLAVSRGCEHCSESIMKARAVAGQKS